MDVSMDPTMTDAPASAPSTSAASAPPASYVPTKLALDQQMYSQYPVSQDVPVGQPIDDWKYEMRREPQLILPHLYLGPFQTSKQLDTLQSLGITHIVCIRDIKEAFLVKPRFPEKFSYLTLDVQDHEDQNLIRIFPQTRDFIDQAIAQGGNVFVHCNGGISLGPSVVVGYVMWKQEFSYEQAMKWVQSRRYCISPNQGFMYQLKEYEPIYRATLASRNAPLPSAEDVARRRKRAGDESDEDEDEGAGMDVEGSAGAVEEWSHRPERRMPRTGER